MSTQKPRLTAHLLQALTSDQGVDVPAADLLDLPETILQFGTGRFLRGFADYIVDKGNRQGHYKGRVLAVQSTGSRRTELLTEQDCLFTVCVQGIHGGEAVEEYEIVSSVSRVLSAGEDWAEVLQAAASDHLGVILSNTTEAGLQLDDDDRFEGTPPASFPAKLTRFLYERFEQLGGSEESGMIILPLELIEDNGDVLLDLVLRTAERWNLSTDFRRWVSDNNVFCNSLVDRIVTGYPPDDELHRHESHLAYRDALLTCTERYHFWAIEGDESVARRLPFADASPNVLVTDDIEPYFERKIRILNGGHTLMSPVGFLCGHDTVHDALSDETVGRYVRELLLKEIAPTLPESVTGVETFVQEVVERWCNPFLNHALHDITMQSTTKLRMRVVPTILRHYALDRGLPERIAFGFASCLAFIKQHMVGGIVGEKDAADAAYSVDDDLLREHSRHWQNAGGHIDQYVKQLLSDSALWGTDLTALSGLSERVAEHLAVMIEHDPVTALHRLMDTIDATKPT
jgi:tagaturonate reductase